MQQSSSVSPAPEPSGFRVGDLLIDIGRQRVMRAEVELPLSQLSFELLLALARAAPNLVSFDQLIERVWPGLVVTQETVSQRVKLVRDALADDPHSPRYIAGVRGRGYRMVALVSVLNTLPATGFTSTQAAPPANVLSREPGILTLPVRHRFARPRLVMAVAAALVVTAAFGLAHFWSATQRPASAGKRPQAVLVQPPKTIAVLPLVDISPAGHNEYLGDGLAQELSSRLARIPGLRVAARTSAFAFKGGHVDVRTIAQTLGVRHVLEGSVRREGDHLRVTAQLIDATSGYQVWSQSYDRSWQDLLVIEDDLARSIIGTLQVVLSSDLALRVGQPPTAHLAAFDLYLSGMAKLRQPATAGQLDEAEGMFRDAIAIDPRFAPAYAGLCERYSMGYQGTRDTALATKAEVACNEALRRDGSLREVEMGLAHLYLVTGRPDQAATILRSVIRNDPTDTDAYIGLADAYEGQQNTAAAEVAYRRAVDAEPGYGVAHTALGNFLFHHGQAAAAVAHYRRVTELAPASAPAFNNLGAAEEMSGDLQSAASAFDESLKLEPTRSAYSNSGTVHYFLGRFADAARLFHKATELAPEDHRVWGNLADALYQIKANRAQAEREYRHAIVLAERRIGVNPDDASTWVELAFYYARVGENTRAAACKARALALDADDFLVQYYAALIALEERNSAAALAALSRAIELGYPTQMVRAAPEFSGLRGDERFQRMLVAAREP
ncbi:MAG: hypothetical protein JWM63_1148 [Gammaproteobacteria bacterium]|jgi:TolB-like protein/tetratricopeptide (TPR) repeat protein/DNA-binding winged helix-turn-helix (wHTH) protein|nr:hypothetical protein [Gammaproteobacteria bacterium]